MKKILLLTLGTLLCFTAGCAGSDQPDAEQEFVPEPASEPAPEPAPEPVPEPRADIPPPDVITGSIEMEDGGLITFELYPDIAPQSVYNFVELARNGFYDGLKFHRIIYDFMIQGGCPYTLNSDLGDPGTGNPGYSILGEFDDNGVSNKLSHNRGVISMARGPDFNTAGSQFFICHGDPQFLDGSYAAFGMVTSGMDVVDKIAETPVINNNGGVRYDDMPMIKSITIDGDFTLPGPDKLGR